MSTCAFLRPSPSAGWRGTPGSANGHVCESQSAPRCRYPGKGAADKKGILLIVTSGKDGALSGGPAFMSAVGDDFIDSVIGENIPILTLEEKYNECIATSTKRIEAVLGGALLPWCIMRHGMFEWLRVRRDVDEAHRGGARLPWHCIFRNSAE